MLQEYKTKTNIGVGLGILIQICGRVLAGQEGDPAAMPFLGLAVLIVGLCVFIWGCMSYARAKGHHPAWGMFGLMSLIGLLVLYFLKDRHKEASA